MKRKVLSILFLLLSLCNCEGDNICGATQSSQVDADSDCVADGSDNCPFLYNPAQVDVDENGLGDACQEDPAALSATLDALAQSAQEVFAPTAHTTTVFKTQTPLDCARFFVGCDGAVFGTWDESTIPDWEDISLNNPNSIFADATQRSSFFHAQNVFANPHTECSAFNPNASQPPQIYCIDAQSQVLWIGHLTLNPDFDDAVSPCELFADAGALWERCE